jgi:hypothetical protein
MKQRGICALCDKEAVLQDSHIIPKFAIKWLKKTSGGMALRSGKNPNKPVQDGPKMKLLCIGCEQKLSALERKFALEIFHPTNENLAHKTTHSDWYCKFCVSVSWRVLNAKMREDSFNNYSQVSKDKISLAYETWKNFLNGKVDGIGEFKQHVLVHEPIVSFEIDDPPPILNTFLQRTTGFALFSPGEFSPGDEVLVTYAKIGRFMIFGLINSPQCHEWKGSEVDALGGEFEPVNCEYPQYIIDFYMNQAWEMLRVQESISDEQMIKSYHKFSKNPHRYLQSDAHKAEVRDFALFGTEWTPKKSKS